ncbi:TPR Domain containing protein [Trichomonas vaginalis G3]|uniref:TPR Domain containing protein n=1 Tax=Trichomonas vaginalis (strain ATCC PRA-98 / G3) TaxID=412133 RepID=A2DB24_TRIV3|nr:cell division [Trichomonas vaginalis G3]EAY22354.1 TPR Domain containing protein [Trichomonas vaginalis G3]KAI5518292.1 cell division [Trichomonas vaginalis G3]|eukprot:XP_001583340.1 TPR Domain containing protein [Trichomonas vaginalis G3]
MEEIMKNMKKSMEDCSWKSVMFYADMILQSKKDCYEAVFCRLYALYAMGNFRELEQWAESLPKQYIADEQLLIIRCKALLENKDYSKIITLLAADAVADEIILPIIVPKEVVESSKMLKYFRDTALFNSGRTETPPTTTEQKSKASPNDHLHPEAITNSIIRAMMNKDPTILHKYTLLSDSRSENDAYIVTACGCYRILCEERESGHALLVKATTIDQSCEIAWLCLIYSFMQAEEWNEAISTLKIVHNRYPNSKSVAMFAMSIHLKADSPSLALPWIEMVGEINDFVKHEHAVLTMLEGFHSAALKVFVNIEENSEERDLKASSAINAGHCQRLMKNYEEALNQYNRAISYGAPMQEALASIGFTHHLMGNIDDAILYYNKSLAVDPVHPFATKMLDIALKSAAKRL